MKNRDLLELGLSCVQSYEDSFIKLLHILSFGGQKAILFMCLLVFIGIVSSMTCFVYGLNHLMHSIDVQNLIKLFF